VAEAASLPDFAISRFELIPEDGAHNRQAQDRLSGSRDSPYKEMRFSRVEVINIPPRQFVHMELQGEFGQAEVLALAYEKWKRVDFVGELPKRPILGALGSKTCRKTITES
jgi:hypothetical protein